MSAEPLADYRYPLLRHYVTNGSTLHIEMREVGSDEYYEIATFTLGRIALTDMVGPVHHYLRRVIESHTQRHRESHARARTAD